MKLSHTAFILALSTVALVFVVRFQQTRDSTVDLSGEVSVDKFSPLQDGSWLRIISVSHPDEDEYSFYLLHQDMLDDFSSGRLLVLNVEIQNTKEDDLIFSQNGYLTLDGERISRLDRCDFIDFQTFPVEPQEIREVTYCASVPVEVETSSLKAVFNKDTVFSEERIFVLP